MSVEVVIKNKQFIKKSLTIQNITMGKYAAGTTDQYMRNTNEVKDGELVVYNPKKIGRGIAVIGWNSDIKNEITLVANSFSTKYDFEMFYDIIGNIMRVWKTRNFEEEGIKYSDGDLERLCMEQKINSLSMMADIETMVKKEEGEDLTFFSAMIPLDIKLGVLRKFGEAKDEEGYANYLHELQSLDAYFAVPFYYASKTKKDTFFGNYAITSDTDTIFPVKPKIPPFFSNPATGKALECSIYVVSLFSYSQKKSVGTLSFEDFVRLADIGNCAEFDASHVILKGISEERMAEMAATEHDDPLAGI